jgi:TRAP-type mannitol/chloroaromatic compound transport system permease small subunit
MRLSGEEVSVTSRVVAGIDAANRMIGTGIAWLTLGMVLFTFAIVVLRYAFDVGPIWMQESVTWMHAAVFMLGGAYALQRDEHVRVDIFYRGMTPAGRARIDIAGVLLFLFPLCAFIFYESFDYVAASWSIREGARDAGGLPYPMISLLKSVLLLMPLLVALQGVSLLLTSVRTLRDHRSGAPGPGS